MPMLFNDADGCFDRIPPVLGAMALQKIGLPASCAKAHTITQRNMSHHLKTAVGVSKGLIKYRPKEAQYYDRENNILALRGEIGGVCQGGGASPIIRSAVLLIMLQAYKKVCNGITLQDLAHSTRVIYWIISYVDDNTILRSFPNNVTTPEIFFL